MNATYYAYDLLNRPVAVTDALDRAEGFSYDAASNLQKYVDAADGVAYYRYGDLNRRTQTKRPDGSYAYFSYDAVGNMVAARDEQGWTYFGYDAVNRLTSQRSPKAETVFYTYDAAGRRVAVNSAAGRAYYCYDEAGRMVKVADMGKLGYGIQPYGTSAYGGAASFGTTYYAWDAASRMRKQAQGNGQATYFTYDRANRLTARKSVLPNGRALTYFEYAYDAASRITKIHREGNRTAYFAYDDADRLTGELWADGGGEIYAFAWSYDPAGNRHYERRGAVETYYHYDAADELTKAHDVTGGGAKRAGARETLDVGSATYFEYDLIGNCRKIVAPDGVTYFSYNSRDLQTRITYRTGVTNYFRYDAFGRRTALVDSAGAAYFTYDADGLCHLVERNGAGGVVAAHTRGTSPIAGAGDLVASKMTRGTTTYYQYPDSDPLGNVNRIVNESGVVTAYFEYDAWRRPLHSAPPAEGTRFGPGAPAWIILPDDPAGTLILTPTRTYHSGIGRMLQRDQARNGNPYAALGNNPVQSVAADGQGARTPNRALRGIEIPVDGFLLLPRLPAAPNSGSRALEKGARAALTAGRPSGAPGGAAARVSTTELARPTKDGGRTEGIPDTSPIFTPNGTPVGAGDGDGDSPYLPGTRPWPLGEFPPSRLAKLKSFWRALDGGRERCRARGMTFNNAEALARFAEFAFNNGYSLGEMFASVDEQFNQGTGMQYYLVELDLQEGGNQVYHFLGFANYASLFSTMGGGAKVAAYGTLFWDIAMPFMDGLFSTSPRLNGPQWPDVYVAIEAGRFADMWRSLRSQACARQR
jgi:YD repeat-containing protein